MKNIRLTLITVALMGLPASGALCAQEKYGIVDVQKVLDTVEEGKKAKVEFQKELEGKKAELDKKQVELKKLDDNFEKQKSVLSQNAAEEKRRELDNKKTELQKYMMSAQSDMQKREMQLSGEILKKIRGIIEKLGRDGGYQMIWEKNEGGVIYFKPMYDITDDVIAQYDKNNKK